MMMKGILLVTLVVMCVLPWQSDAFYWFRGTQQEGQECDYSSKRCARWPSLRCECGVCTRLLSLGRSHPVIVILFINSPFQMTYTLHLNKVTFNLSICPGGPGSLTLTDGLDDSVKYS